MTNKYNAIRVYYHPHCGYFKGKQALDDYYDSNKVESSKILKSDFMMFDSIFESEVHKLLTKWVNGINKTIESERERFVLLNQVAVDIGQPNFCTMGYRIDFFIGQLKPLGFKKQPDIKLKPSGMMYKDLGEIVATGKALLIEAKGLFTAESRYKHLLLEHSGFRHDKQIVIVQSESQYVSRGSKCYRTLTPNQLIDKLNQRFKG